MSSNDKIILEQIIDQQHQERAPATSKSEFFEIFVAEQVLKDFDLGYDEIESGIVDGSQDGGIDSMYVIVNGELAQEDFDLSPLKRGVVIETVLIQSKLADGFSETAVEKLTASTEDLFNLAKDLDALKSVFNEGVRASVGNFRRIYAGLASKFPTLRFRYVYATKGAEVHPNVVRKTEILGEKLRSLFSHSDFSFDFLGASNLLSLARQEPPLAYSLSLAENPISSAGDVGYVALVKLRDFNAFIRDDIGRLRRNLFEANVRDYQGSTTVNEEISTSLRTTGGEDFWWLNNGVTIIAAKATVSAKTLTLEDPQIVNGLQTSNEIYRYFKEANTSGDERNLLMRVIVPTKPESRDRVIKATNSQTTIPAASLRATDKIHRDIEEHLRPYGLFYDRRKNFYKNEGRSVDQIVSISLMAQAVMSIVLQRPDDARARPSSLLKKDEDYARVFSTKMPVGLYRVAAVIIKKVFSALRSRTDLDAQGRNNLLFYVSMRVAAVAVGSVAPTAADVASLDTSSIDDVTVAKSIDIVKSMFDALGGNDQVAKGSQLVEQLKAEIAQSTQ
ncbi:AIPR family protein [Burkholderia ubonensis]|uniref:Abortive phage resistance protein n=1 Tax=Burkholderia ubonensis TaxID=101571 RepID=A0A1R1J5F1_9BURK|nr:AIPR family protein [Burkholderia ubonensis]OMG70446.1 abortive phage resistance protein [Burkholderia ubonensis]